MNNRNNKTSILKAGLLLLIAAAGVAVFSGCSTSATSIPKGWAGAVTDNGTLYIGSMEGNIVSISLQNDSITWSAPLETEAPASSFLSCARASASVAIYGSPSTAEGLVFVAGYNGKVYAFAPGQNDPRWVYPRQDYISAIIGGTVASNGSLYFGSANDIVYALNASDGFKEWEFDTGDKIWSTPAVMRDR